MASHISSIGAHEPEHSHPTIATPESPKSSNDQSVIKTHTETPIMMAQAEIQKGVEREVIASDVSSIGLHEPEHSHPPVATHESLKFSNDQSLIKTQIESSTMTDQADIQKGIQQPRSREKAVPGVTSKDEFNSTPKSLVSPTNQILPKTEAKDIIMTDEADTQERMQRTPPSDSEVQMISQEEFDHRNQKITSKSRKENKRTSKRIKKQKSRITELTVQADLDEDGFIDARAELQVCRKNLQDPKTKLQEATVQLRASPRDLKTRKNQLSHAENNFRKARQAQQELASVRREQEASQDDLRQRQSIYKELQRTRRKLAASQDELTACKDEVFRLQPIAQIPDSRVAKELENLCQQLVNWIEAEVAIFVQAHPEDGQEHIFSIGENMEAGQFMTQHPRGGEHLAAHLIHSWLQDHLFGQKFSCSGMPAEAIQLLERAEQSMARLDPPRDSATIAAWRSETLKALASTEECKKTRVLETQDMNDRLFKDLSKTLPILFSGPQRHSSFCVQILEPAVTLACTIQESTSRYVWSLQKGLLEQWVPFGRAVLENQKIVDIKTGKCLRPNSAITADQEGSIGTAILMVEPGLCRVNEACEGHILKRGTYIVNLKFPLQKRNRL